MTQPMPETRLLLDTTVIIDVLRNRNQRRSLLEKLVVSGTVLATSTVCIAEIYSGLRPGEAAHTKAQLANLEPVPVSASIAERAGLIKAALARLGQTHSLLDMMIAATAMEIGSSLATDNQKHFQIPGLTLFPLP
jgi:predicted nucleic acid-binding protein